MISRWFPSNLIWWKDSRGTSKSFLLPYILKFQALVETLCPRWKAAQFKEQSDFVRNSKQVVSTYNVGSFQVAKDDFHLGSCYSPPSAAEQKTNENCRFDHDERMSEIQGHTTCSLRLRSNKQVTTRPEISDSEEHDTRRYWNSSLTIIHRVTKSRNLRVFSRSIAVKLSQWGGEGSSFCAGKSEDVPRRLD